jgi:putative resolvase
VIPDNVVQKVRRKDYIVTYARVSSSENKQNLETQSQRLINFCNAKGWQTSENIKEVGSGVNDNRKKLLKVLQDRIATKIIVEHKDRLTRFGFNYILTICKSFNCEIVIINETDSQKEDIIQDFIFIITSFCSKIYGQRRSKRKTEEIIKELRKNT